MFKYCDGSDGLNTLSLSPEEVVFSTKQSELHEIIDYPV